MQSQSTTPCLGYKRIPKYTKLIDISSSDYSSQFEKNTNYEIRRASKEDVRCEFSSLISDFVTFYNIFSASKGLDSKVSEMELNSYGDALVITNARNKEDDILVFHSYIVDRQIKRARLLHSASKIYSKEEVLIDKAFIGRVNRFLHSEDMIYFKNEGFATYDFGGYAFETSDTALKGINKFKDNFGGILVEESIYEAYPKVILKNIYKKAKRTIKNIFRSKLNN